MKKSIPILVTILTLSLSFTPSLPATASPISGDASTGWNIETKSSACRVIVDKDKQVKLSHFGPKARAGRPSDAALLDEIPVRGRAPNGMPLLEVIFPDNVRDIELVFSRADIREIDGRQTLVIEQKDKYYPLRVTSYIRVIPELDIMEKWLDITNDGAESIRVQNMKSGSFAVPGGEYDLTTLGGFWSHEFLPETARLTSGLKTIEVRDFKSHGSSYFVLRPAGENRNAPDSGRVWSGMLNYSGNWKVDFYKQPLGFAQVSAGINFWDTELELKPRMTRSTPKMVIGFTEGGVEAASHNMSDYVRSQLLRPSHRDKPRPVLYNSWYATTFNVNEKQQLALARVAKEIGVEMFVIDDGWFKGRVNSKAGLGDWTVDRKKFPNGLAPLIKQINDLGMDFGIWIEPEMINPNSDLYRKHPDWILHFPNRERTLMRNQAVLNLAREDVCQYLLQSFSDLLANNNIKFVKWDHNRAITQPGWPGEPLSVQLETRLRYMDNLCRLIKELTARFPDVWFENCSGGGGRADGGMMSLMDMTWISDNTDPVDRQFIQWGYLNFMPASTMICWTTRQDHHQLNPSLDYKFDVSMQGVLGVGNDITKWTPEELATAKTKIALYKKIRDIVQNGRNYTLISPYEGARTAMQYMSREGGRGVLMLYNRQRDLQSAIVSAGGRDGRKPLNLRLRGLERDATYTIDGHEGAFTGAFLMDEGIPWPLRKAYESRVLIIQRQTQ